MTEPLLHVVIDAQAIVKEGFGTSGTYRHLLNEAADGRIELIVPELAVLETAFVLRRRLHEHRKALKELPLLLRAAGVTAELAIEQLQAQCERRLRADLAAAGVTPAPAPTVDGDTLVRRILARRKPTKALTHDDKGKERSDQPEGFRDQLLWALVRETAVAQPVAFVSANTKDFSAPGSVRDGRAELHPDLVEDLAVDRADRGSTGEVELFVDIATLVREELQDEDILADAERLLAGEAGQDLRREISALVDARGVTMDEFSPEELVEGDIEDARLETFSASNADVEIQDAYLESGDGDPRRYGVNVTINGEGDVAWYVSAPTGGDIEAFGDHVENVDDGGGLLQWTDNAVPVVLSVYGEYEPSTQQWDNLTIDYASMPAEEVKRRVQQHNDEEFRRLQMLGLEPSDEEIAEMSERYGQ